jgi:3-methyladenine DNA glycosylase Tag
MDESVWSNWFYRTLKPPSESAVFENLTRCVFQAGLNWTTIGNKWPATQVAFQGFDIPLVASYGAEAIGRLMDAPGIIHNRNKILATIHNAREFERFQQENGGFILWLDAQDKMNNYRGVIRRMGSRFKFVGPTVATVFLYSIGEDVKFEKSQPS